MTGRRASAVISAQESAHRLDYWLARRFTYLSRHQWQRRIRCGSILVNGRAGKASLRLRTGDTVEYKIAAYAEPVAAIAHSVIYEDDLILLLDKPAHLPCHPSGRYFARTLWYTLSAQLDTVRFVNRLDRETSGLVLVAKTAVAARELSRQFSTRNVKKEYLVLVHGSFPETMTATGYLSNDLQSRVRKKRAFTTADHSNGEHAVTHFARIDVQNDVSLVAAMPVTGRCHQIRATLCSLGFPVVGDKIYGVDEGAYLAFIAGDDNGPVDSRNEPLSRQALHAYTLEFCHPRCRSRQTFIAPIPADFRTVLNTLQLQAPMRN